MFFSWNKTHKSKQTNKKQILPESHRRQGLLQLFVRKLHCHGLPCQLLGAKAKEVGVVPFLGGFSALLWGGVGVWGGNIFGCFVVFGRFYWKVILNIWNIHEHSKRLCFCLVMWKVWFWGCSACAEVSRKRTLHYDAIHKCVVYRYAMNTICSALQKKKN